MAITTIEPDRGDIGLRVDRVLLRHLAHLRGASRNRLQRLIDQGAVRINGAPVTRSSRRVLAGDSIAVDLPAQRERSAPVAEALPLNVLYEDDDLLVVDKPPGQVSHPSFRNRSGTLINALLAYSGGRWTPALVTRLDKATSGLVLVAKVRAMHATLQRLGERQGIEKSYLAIVGGRPPMKGTIDLALDRHPSNRRRMAVRDRGGVRSVTTFQRLRTVAIASGRYISLIRCGLVTGRMHQIRVHLAAKGWPIVGDPVYGITSALIDRQALHAWHLAFTHPVTRAQVEVTAPIPADIELLLRELGLIRR